MFGTKYIATCTEARDTEQTKDHHLWLPITRVYHHSLLGLPNIENWVPWGTRGTQCASSRCDSYNHLIAGDRFSSHASGTSYNINCSLDCISRNVHYLISCKVCGFQYVGFTTTKFSLRFNSHKSRLRAHSRMSAANKEGDDLIRL